MPEGSRCDGKKYSRVGRDGSWKAKQVTVKWTGPLKWNREPLLSFEQESHHMTYIFKDTLWLLFGEYTLQ